MECLRGAVGEMGVVKEGRAFLRVSVQEAVEEEEEEGVVEFRRRGGRREEERRREDDDDDEEEIEEEEGRIDLVKVERES